MRPSEPKTLGKTNEAITAQPQHPDERLNAQLLGLRERREKLVEISKRDLHNPKHAELIAKIEKAIDHILANASSSSPCSKKL